ncbi:unnamed protein product, partial [Phaeothamnion confervicola]
MKLQQLLFTILLVCALASAAFDAAECGTLGFRSPSCSTCSRLREILGDADIADECFQCCVAMEVKKYPRAVLELDKRTSRFYPEVDDFIGKKANSYASLEVTVRSTKLHHGKVHQSHRRFLVPCCYATSSHNLRSEPCAFGRVTFLLCSRSSLIPVPACCSPSTFVCCSCFSRNGAPGRSFSCTAPRRTKRRQKRS